jgi:hypothetical protein
MKKLIWTVVIAVSFMINACKNSESDTPSDETELKTEDTGLSEENSATDSTVFNSVESVDIEVPVFDSEEVQQFAEEYAEYLKELIETSRSGNDEKTMELMQSGVEWNKQATELSKKMGQDDKQLWTDWTNKLRKLAEGE